MVKALTEDNSIHNYAQRKRALRAQVIGAGTTVIDIALADKIASPQHAQITATRVRRRKLAHHDATRHSPLVALAEDECQPMAAGPRWISCQHRLKMTPLRRLKIHPPF